MLDHSHLPGQGNGEVFRFVGQVQASTPIAPQVFQKPRGKSMFHIQLIGKGGDGGAGVIGAVSTAAGGGGGGSGGQTSILIPAWALPDMLYLFLAGVGSPSGSMSYVSVRPVANAAVQQILAVANGGSNGGNASGATAGSAGGAANAAGPSGMSLGYMWLQSALAGQPGVAGGTTTNASALTLPATGLVITGGTGGSGLGASGAAGSYGGSIGSGIGDIPRLPGGLGGSSTTTPPENGKDGISPLLGCNLSFGGTGGGATHGSATGAGLVQASGGNGAPGCGGGGSGGALTGSTAGVVGKGGPAMCIITCW